MGRGLQTVGGSELIGTQGAKVQRWFKKVKRCRGGLKAKRCRSAQVHRCRRSRGAGAQVQAQQRWCRAGAEEQRYGGAEMQRCRDAEVHRHRLMERWCRDADMVQWCRGEDVVQG